MEHVLRNRRLKNFLVSAGFLALATLAGFVFASFGLCHNCVHTFYTFAVFMIARYTSGYLPGILSSFAGIVLLNYLFMAPHLTLNFFQEGYPVTLLCMLTMGILTSALVTQYKESREKTNEMERDQAQKEFEQTQRELEQELERAKDKLDAVRQRTRANLLRSISHDFRTPLTKIMYAASSVLSDGEAFTTEQKEEYLNSIISECNGLVRMMENILLLTKTQSEDVVLNMEQELAEDVIGAAYTKFKGTYPDIHVETEIQSELMLIPMSMPMILQVLMNLMENSVEHGESTTTIWLKVHREGDLAVFSVEDDGVGFSPEREKPVSADSKKRNMGIGLELCDTIINAHGGTSERGNRPEGGAIATFRLPISKVIEL